MEGRMAGVGGGRVLEDVDGFKGSFLELLVEEDDVSEVAEDAGLAFFTPSNKFPSISSPSSSTAQMLCFGGDKGYGDGSFLSASHTSGHGCKHRTKRSCPSASNGRRRRRGAEISSYSRHLKAEAEVSTVSRSVRSGREKIGSHVRALQQLVSPMGKSDTASVLHETFGYIRFLLHQVQVLSSAYQEAKTECQSDSKGGEGCLRMRGLCLVPISNTVLMTGRNGADIWASAISMNGGRAPPSLRRASSNKSLLLC